MILSTVKKYIESNNLILDNDKVIVGVSGGADSVALLDILLSLGYVCIVAHCNFHLRGEESVRDARFVEKLCSHYNVDFYSVDFDTKGYALLNSISIEMAARQLRYNWFEELRIQLGAQSIAVAHHQDDSIETVLLNLIRGTGIVGLTGISSRNKYVIRPLLCISRKVILEYLNSNNLSFVEDHTNFEDQYTRNKIRLNILPLLQSINPSVSKSILQTSENLSQVEKIYRSYIDQAREEILENNKVSIYKLLNCVSPQAVLFEILSKYNFKGDIVKHIFASLETQSGKLFFSPTHQLLKDRDYLIIREKETKTESKYNLEEGLPLLSYPLQLRIETLLTTDLTIEKSKNIIYLDKDKLIFPLQLRHWQQGDWFIPFGMCGKKKISDFFSDNKYSLFDKENAWLLCSGKNIVWIVGKRADNRYRITEETSVVLKISLLSS